jgi:hypothetical protein
MLKVRYFRIQLPSDVPDFIESVLKLQRKDDGNQSRVKIIQSSDRDVVFTCTYSRLISIRRILEDGSEVVDNVPTIDLHSFRIFQAKRNQYLSIIDPPRGARFISELLDSIMGDGQYFLEPLEFTPELIKRHASKFDSARLVSAKVRDFEVYEGAIGRLEITSQSGLMPNIAPFLTNKFHRVDSLTYEVSQKYIQGLVYYYRNGTLKVSGPLVELAFPSFETCFE